MTNINTEGKTPLSAANAKTGTEILVNQKAFRIEYENATITEVKPPSRSGDVGVKFITADGKNGRLIARAKPTKSMHGNDYDFQAYLA